jgi:regulator of cell morphogenesis and NO signaling
MTSTTERTVRQIVLENPAAARVFESLGIDYCCGGNHPLPGACARAGVSLDEAVLKLEALAAEPADSEDQSWADASLAELTAHIVNRHHAYVRAETPRLEALLAKVISKHGERHPELRAIGELFGILTRDLASHMQKEELILFPHLGERDAAAPIAVMLSEHDAAGALTARIRSLSANYQPPAAACPTYRALLQGLQEFERDLHTHVHLENNVLFPRALKMESPKPV